MKLLTKEIIKSLPALGSTEVHPDPIVQVKFFVGTGGSNGRWYATEYDPKTKTFFGYVTGLQEDELGYFSLTEFEDLNKRFKANETSISIERDLYFKPCPLSKIKSGESF